MDSALVKMAWKDGSVTGAKYNTKVFQTEDVNVSIAEDNQGFVFVVPRIGRDTE